MSIPRTQFLAVGALTILFTFAGLANAKVEESKAAAKAPAAAKTPAEKSKSTADHSKFKELDKNFKTGPEVTKACLECHTEAAEQVQHTKHWN